MRDLTIDKYETSNTIGAKETIMTGSYGQTVEHIKDKIKVSDIFSSNNFFMTSLKAEFDAYKKENPKDNMSYETYQQRRLNSRAFNYDSIKDQQQNKKFWRDVGILGTTLLLAGATVFFPPASAALFAFTASVGVMEVPSAVTGKDWLAQRKLDTNERWLRGVLGFVDVAPVAKGLHAFGNVTTGLKSGVSTTTIKGASKVGLEAGGSRLKQADNLLTERAQNANRLSGKKFDNLSLNIEKKTPVENAPVIEKKSATFFDGLNLKNGTKVAGQAQNANRLSGEKVPEEGIRKAGVGKTGEGIPLEEVKPDVLKQIHPDDNGAYGYLPNEGTAYHKPEYDFTDVDWVKGMQNVRKDYLEASKQLEIDIKRMTSEGFSKEDIAKHVVDARNQQKVTARADMTAEERAGLEARDMEKYDNPIGPDSQWLFSKTKKKLIKEGTYINDDEIWSSIIKKSMKKDDVINTLLGLIH
ncbi:hypothetical protein [Bacillus paramycoides]|uniref:hypothetical protein n=2 Tax=Bacillus cereus group TaxID=86661 RepID=UPI003D19CC27